MTRVIYDISSVWNACILVNIKNTNKSQNVNKKSREFHEAEEPWHREIDTKSRSNVDAQTIGGSLATGSALCFILKSNKAFKCSSFGRWNTHCWNMMSYYQQWSQAILKWEAAHLHLNLALIVLSQSINLKKWHRRKDFSSDEWWHIPIPT